MDAPAQEDQHPDDGKHCGRPCAVGWKELIKAKLLRLLFDVAVTGGTAHRRYLEQLGFLKARSPVTTMS